MRKFSMLAIIALSIMTVSLNAEEQKEWNFEDTALATLPAGWKIDATNLRGKYALWGILVDSQNQQKTNVLAMIKANDNFGGTFNLCWTDAVQATDVEIQVKFKAIKGIEDQGGGPIWHVKDADNYYVARANPLESNFRLYYVKDGARRTLDSSRVKIPSNQWHTIKIVQIGTHIEGYLDGKKYLEYNDATFPYAGGIGLWTKADAVTYFDDLKVVKLK